MKNSICLISSIAFLFLFSDLFSQEISEGKLKNQTLQVEVSGPLLVASYTINYNAFINEGKFKPYFGIGAQYFPHSKSNENVFMAYPQFGLLIGKENMFEMNLGLSLDFKYLEHMLSIYTGYRYISKQNTFNFKVGFTTYYLGKSGENSFIDLPMFFPTPTIAFGVAW